MGIGGSAISRAGHYAMVDRWQDIPLDSDIIIVFGGSNDCLFETNEEFGNIEYDQRKVSETFCGDLDEMLSSIEREYVIENDYAINKFIPYRTICQEPFAIFALRAFSTIGGTILEISPPK